MYVVRLWSLTEPRIHLRGGGPYHPLDRRNVGSCLLRELNPDITKDWLQYGPIGILCHLMRSFVGKACASIQEVRKEPTKNPAPLPEQTTKEATICDAPGEAPMTNRTLGSWSERSPGTAPLLAT